MERSSKEGLFLFMLLERETQDTRFGDTRLKRGRHGTQNLLTHDRREEAASLVLYTGLVMTLLWC